MKKKNISEETRRKLSESHKGKRRSLESRRKQSEKNTGEGNPFFGKKHTQEVRKKMSEHNLLHPRKYWLGKKRPGLSKSLIGIKRSPESIKKMKDALTGRKVSPEHLESIRKAMKKRSGSNSHFWKGGISKDLHHYVLERKERVRKNGGYHSENEWKILKAQYNWTYPCCRKSEPEIKLTRDRIIPTIKGGSNNIENIQPLCKTCNSRKNTKSTKYQIYD